jgi:hypothetical protein
MFAPSAQGRAPGDVLKFPEWQKGETRLRPFARETRNSTVQCRMQHPVKNAK